MKIILLALLLILLSGCATSIDTQSVNLLSQRISNLEKSNVNERTIQTSSNNDNNSLNTAQKDFVIFMLEYLKDPE